MPAVAFGSWPSPIAAEMVASGATDIESIALSGNRLFWSERRSSEGGRVAIVERLESGELSEVLPDELAARSGVHEYGGRAWWLGASDLYLVNWSDQRIYSIPLEGGDPVALTPEPEERHGWRYADGIESADGNWIYCVREDHRVREDQTTDADEAVNEIVAVPTNGSGEVEVLASGADFYAAPRVSPDGRWLSYLRWNHPNMPWDGTELCAAPLFDGPRLGNLVVVAGGEHESIVGPDWHSDGHLVYSTDTNGFWNLASWMPATGTTSAITTMVGAEIGTPAWVFGLQRWVEVEDGSLLAVVTEDASDSLVLIRPDLSTTELSSKYTHFSSLVAVDGGVMAVAASPTGLPDVIEVNLASGTVAVRRPGDDLGLDDGWLSEPESFDFASADGRTCHSFFYPPSGHQLTGTEGELPPLVVMGHGGPTSHASPVLSLKINYWTSRGFAVADVNYAGSSGFGRAYRELLKPTWGVADVEDCVAVAEKLAESGRVDAGRCVIRGGSAGGLTVLNALVTSDTFAGGTSLYGVADLAALTVDDHKFESRYTLGLVGPYPEAADVYAERSPINHADSISSPLLVLQGLEDKVVQPSQSEAIVAAVAASGLPHAAIYFEGEQHGFRQASTIIRSLEAELWFYGRVLGFEPADEIEPVAGAVGL